MLDSAAVINAMGAADSAPQSDFDSSKIIQAMQSPEKSSPPAQQSTASKVVDTAKHEWDSGNVRRLMSPFHPLSNPSDIADLAEVGRADLSGMAHSVAGGLAGAGVDAFQFLKNLANGESVESASQKANQAAVDVINKVQSDAYQPQREGAKSFQESLVNPSNLIGKAIGAAGDMVGNKVEEATGSPTAAALAKGLTEISPNLLGLRGKAKPQLDLRESLTKEIPKAESDVNYTGRQPTVTTAKIIEEPADTPKTEPEALKEHADLLHRIGLEKVRENVLKGDKFGSSVDFQISKSPEAAGEAARAQFAAERNALENHAQSLVHDTGGSVGMDEYTVHNRGNVIAKPFDDYRAYFDKAEKNLYQQADEASQGAPIVQTGTVEQLLNDRTFKNTLMAQKQEGLLNSMKDQLDNFKENNPDGLTVKNAEQFRQWLNKNWNHENSAIIGEVKAALDNDTFSAAGSDIYSAARKLHQLKIQTLDAPNSMAKLFDANPNEPLNRRTPLKDIPDTILKLDPDNFKNVLNTLKNMPEDLQPQAQQAIAEIKAHAANKLSEIGSQHQVQWNSRGVNQFIKNNGAKLDMLFDKPEEVQKIADLQSAGNLLRFESSYPGAAAQTQQFLKRGVGTSLITPAATVTGEALATLLGVPMGLGGAAGSVTGAKMAANTAEKAAAKKFEKSVTNLNDMTKVKK